MSDLSLSARPLLARPSRALSLALLVFVAGLIYIDQTVSNRQAALWVVGTLRLLADVRAAESGLAFLLRAIHVLAPRKMREPKTIAL